VVELLTLSAENAAAISRAIWTPEGYGQLLLTRHFMSSATRTGNSVDPTSPDTLPHLGLDLVVVVAPNQPIRANGITFDPSNPEIGYAKFSQAEAAWKQLFP
jgi:hypothetical protein